MRSFLTSEDWGFARDQAVVSETLFSQVPQRDSMNIDAAEELFLVMVRQRPGYPEEAVYVLKTPPRPAPPEYRVVHGRAKDRLAFKDASVGANFWEVPIDAEAVHALERSWGTMARGARWLSREDTIGQMKWGGVRYTFDYRGDNVYGQGSTVSPNRASCTSELVTLGELLIRYADEPDPTKRQPIRAELLRRAQALTERLRASGEPLAGEP